MADAYEREHMAGDGEVLHREKAVVPRWVFPVVAGLPLASGGIATAFLLLGSAPLLAALAPVLGATALALIAAGLLLTFAVGRVAVSEGALHIQIGTAGPKIPIDDIASFDIGESGTRRHGLGYKKLSDGTEIYNLMGQSARAVRIHLHSRKAAVVVVPRDPEALVGALNRAKAAATTGARVEAEEPAEEEVEEEVEATDERARGRGSD